MSTTAIKTVFAGEIRRVSVDKSTLELEKIKDLVRKQFSALGDKEVLLQYVDDEDDKVRDAQSDLHKDPQLPTTSF